MNKRVRELVAVPAGAEAILDVASVSAASETIGLCQGSTPYWFAGVALDRTETGAIVRRWAGGRLTSRTTAPPSTTEAPTATTTAPAVHGRTHHHGPATEVLGTQGSEPVTR